MKRRDFLYQSSILAAGLGLGYAGPFARAGLATVSPPFAGAGPDPVLREVLLNAIDAATRAGASYADARI
ncbi:MAG TPA: twin-arginine translocation signal domain-containing protein, partial [Longimicrobiales bacterium]|nr:twin-arginine translocation signal domain-containing protein [Longimicrobiales bacterium]